MLKSFIYYINYFFMHCLLHVFADAGLIALVFLLYFLLLPPLRLILNFFTTFVLLAFKCINYLAIKLENGLYALKNYVDDPRWNASILSKVLISPARLVVGLLNTTFLILLFIPLNHFGNFLKEMSVALYLPDSVSLALDCLIYLPFSLNHDKLEYFKTCKEQWSSGTYSATTFDLFLCRFRMFSYWVDCDRKDFGLGNIKKFSLEGNYRQNIISKPEGMYLATRNFFLGKYIITETMKFVADPVFNIIYWFIDLLFIPVRSIITVYSYILKQSYVFLSFFIGEFNFEEPCSQFNTPIYLIIGIFPIFILLIWLVALFGYDREHFVITDMFPFKDGHLQNLFSWTALVADNGLILISIMILKKTFSKASEIFIPLIMAQIGLLVNIFTCLYDAAFGEPNSTNTNISAFVAKTLEPTKSDGFSHQYDLESPNPSPNGATGTLTLDL